jgi:two-component SAPR family response regulator
VVGPAARSAKTLELAEQAAVDFAILDVNLAGQESYSVAGVLAARNVPFVFATSYDLERLRAPYGDRPFLHKPRLQSDLQKVIAGSLSRTARRRRGDLDAGMRGGALACLGEPAAGGEAAARKRRDGNSSL